MVTVHWSDYLPSEQMAISPAEQDMNCYSEKLTNFLVFIILLILILL